MIRDSIRSLKKLDSHTLEVLLSSSSTLLVRISGMAVGLAISIVLGNAIGPKGLGLIYLSEKIVSLASVFVYLGLDNVVRKKVAIAYDQKEWKDVTSVVYTAFWINVPFAALVSLLLIVCAPFIGKEILDDESVLFPLIAASLMLTVQVASKIYAMAVNGFRKVWQSSFLFETISNFTVGLLILAAWVLSIEITLVRVVFFLIAGKLISYFSLYIYWNRLHKNNERAEFIARPMLRVGLPLMFVFASALVASGTDAIMLGWLTSADDVGVYSIAARLALLTSFLQVIAVSSLTPKIASLYARGDVQSLEVMVRRVTGVLGIVGLSSFVFFILFGKSLLGMWGDEFEGGYYVLVFLSLGQFVNIGTGATGIILMMTEHEKALGRITVVSALLNVLMNYLLISEIGLIGAAIATSLTMIVQKSMEYFIVRNELGISILGWK